MTNPNDTAYPFQDNGTTIVPQLGLTKLEHFSFEILKEYYSHFEIIQRMANSSNPQDVLYKHLAEGAVSQAKALIEALNKEGK